MPTDNYAENKAQVKKMYEDGLKKKNVYDDGTVMEETMESIFEFLNPHDRRDCDLDLHGLKPNFAIKKLEFYLKKIQMNLKEGFRYNKDRDEGHIFRVVTGAGNNSKHGFPALLMTISEYFIENKYNFYRNEEHGVFLIHIEK